MRIWTPADIGSIVSFPRKHGRQRDYFRVMGIDQESSNVDLQALSKEEAATEQAKQDQLDRLGDLCWQYYGRAEGCYFDGIQVKQ